MLEERLARGRHLHVKLVANEELNSEQTLEALDLLRESGLRDSEADRGSTEVEFLRHSDEISKLSQLERHSFPSSRRTLCRAPLGSIVTTVAFHGGILKKIQSASFRRDRMPRPKTYTDSQVVEAAKDVFWENGFAGTAISALERGTGVNRSSLYHTFGAKRALFALALKSYVADFVDPLLDAMERQAPRLSAITTFFLTLSALFTSDQRASERGCLLVNVIGERPAGYDEAAEIIEAFPERLRKAFRRCLKGSSTDMTNAQVDRRAAMLATATLGVWLTARVDPRTAAVRCEDIAREVASWSRRSSRRRTLSR
jgi:AcrR family transcriptional regulator